MRYYYGEKNILRALDEAEFWKHQEAEHTAVIQAVTPSLEENYTAALKDFGIRFGDAYGDAVKNIQTIIRSNGDYLPYAREMTDFILYCVTQSNDFVKLLDHMLRNSAAVKKNSTAQTVIQHIIRESKYFIGIDRLMLQ